MGFIKVWQALVLCKTWNGLPCYFLARSAEPFFCKSIDVFWSEGVRDFAIGRSIRYPKVS